MAGIVQAAPGGRAQAAMLDVISNDPQNGIVRLVLLINTQQLFAKLINEALAC
jgi:hypothetical protein